MSTTKHTRREWLAMATAALAAPMFIPRTVFAQGARPGANERLGVAGIGVGRQGAPVLANILRDTRTVGICVCDVWQRRANEVAARHNITDTCQDYRKVIDRKDVERLLGITQTPAGQLLKKLVEAGSLVKSGNGKNTKYLFTEQGSKI